MNIWQVTIDGYSHTRAFDTVALCLRESIRDLGFKSEIVYIPNKGIVLGAHLLDSVPEGCIIYNLEQITPDSPFFNEKYLNILKNNKVWDYSKRNILELSKLGIEAVHMPIGYHSALSKIPDGYLQQMDCLFYGSMNLRRKAILENIADPVVTVFDIYGKELDACIASSKIILNCHYYNTQLFEIVRCSYLMANKRFILSEPGLDLELESPFKEGIAFHPKEDWSDAVEFYLKFPDIREKIANKGFEIFSQMKQVEFLKGNICHTS
jgi:hypothetical protein